MRVLDRQNRLVTQKDWERGGFRISGTLTRRWSFTFFTQREFYYQTKGLNVWALYDCGAVAQNIMLLATKHDWEPLFAQAAAYPVVLRKALDIPESKIVL
jgi:hypothetical protein